jgi:uncharacterized protein Usg
MTDPSPESGGYRLATAEVFYHLPDYPHVLQCFVWQHLDIAPAYPVLRRFLDFWMKNIDGKLHSVRVGRQKIMWPGEVRYAQVAYLH